MAKCSKAIGKNIAERLRGLGISQAELARRVGQSSAYINQLIKGANQNPALAILEGIAAALSISLAELVTDPEEFRALRNADHPVEECYRRLGEFLKKNRSTELP